MRFEEPFKVPLANPDSAAETDEGKLASTQHRIDSAAVKSETARNFFGRQEHLGHRNPP